MIDTHYKTGSRYMVVLLTLLAHVGCMNSQEGTSRGSTAILLITPALRDHLDQCKELHFVVSGKATIVASNPKVIKEPDRETLELSLSANIHEIDEVRMTSADLIAAFVAQAEKEGVPANSFLVLRANQGGAIPAPRRLARTISFQDFTAALSSGMLAAELRQRIPLPLAAQWQPGNLTQRITDGERVVVLELYESETGLPIVGSIKGTAKE